MLILLHVHLYKYLLGMLRCLGGFRIGGVAPKLLLCSAVFVFGDVLLFGSNGIAEAVLPGVGIENSLRCSSSYGSGLAGLGGNSLVLS